MLAAIRDEITRPIVMPHTIARRIGSWILEGELGRGSMSVVHGVVHSRFGGRAAIKLARRMIFTTDFTPATFLREARVARAVGHPGVITVYGTGTCDDRPYLVLERLVGRSLRTLLAAGPPLPTAYALDILLELCDVLRAAHGAGVVHRDLKLDNVFVLDRPYAPGRRVKLIDWALAHIAGAEDPFQGMIAGTLAYVAPELLMGEAVTPAADIYALAVVAYHVLCGTVPFAATTDLELISMHLHAEPPRASSMWPDIPPALDDLLRAMLAKSAHERPSLTTIERELTAALASSHTCAGDDD